jgi:integrase
MTGTASNYQLIVDTVLTWRSDLRGKINEQTIRRMKMNPPKNGSRIEWDSEIKGFGARITAAGVVSFVLNYRFAGMQRGYAIGRWPEMTASAARDEAMTLKNGIRQGVDPQEEKTALANEPTLGDLASEYLASDAEAKKRPATQHNDRGYTERFLLPMLGKRRLSAIGERDIEALHASLKATPYQANRVLALLSSMFNYAIKRKWRTDNPAKGVKKFHEEKRERFLTIEEIQRFREALDDYPNQSKNEASKVVRLAAANALRMLLLTGSRAGEVLKARWEEFDLDRGVWTKPSHHTKQKKTEHIPLSEPALELLIGMRPLKASGPLFPGADGRVARVSLKRPWIQACKAAGLVTVEVVEGKRRHEVRKYKPTVRVHDLRHSFASHLVSSGVGLQIVGKLLGHTQAATTMRYAHLHDESLRAATNQLAKVIAFEKKMA